MPARPWATVLGGSSLSSHSAGQHRSQPSSCLHYPVSKSSTEGRRAGGWVFPAGMGATSAPAAHPTAWARRFELAALLGCGTARVKTK